MKKDKVILAYSGGLDTSVAIPWLKKTYGYDVIAVTADLGEGKDLDEVKSKALKIGAIQSHVVDLKSEFAENYLASALKANALYEGVYPLISALSRPLIAKKLVEIAHETGAVAIAHGCTGKGNDQVRFDVAIKTLAPQLKVVAPVREAAMNRTEAIEFAKAHGIPLPIDSDQPYSIDANLWGRSCECGDLEAPSVEPGENAYALTQPPEKAPETSQYVTIDFQQGVPIALDDQKLSLDALIAALNRLAGKHGIGRIDHIENRLVGMKSREIYEAPAALTLIQAHQALEALCLTRDTLHFKTIVEQKFANMVYEGYWYSPLLTAINAFIDQTQMYVTGRVRMKFYKGHAQIIGRQAGTSLYQLNLATYNPNDTFDHRAAEGFIKLWGLPLEVFSLVNQSKGLSS